MSENKRVCVLCGPSFVGRCPHRPIIGVQEYADMMDKITPPPTPTGATTTGEGGNGNDSGGDAVLRDLAICLKSHDPQSRVLGNVAAGDALAALSSLLSRLAAAEQKNKELEATHYDPAALQEAREMLWKALHSPLMIDSPGYTNTNWGLSKKAAERIGELEARVRELEQEKEVALAAMRHSEAHRVELSTFVAQARQQQREEDAELGKRGYWTTRLEQREEDVRLLRASTNYGHYGHLAADWLVAQPLEGGGAQSIACARCAAGTKIVFSEAGQPMHMVPCDRRVTASGSEEGGSVP